MKTFKNIVLAVALAAAGVSTGAQASIIGNTVTATGLYLTPDSAPVKGGPEFYVKPDSFAGKGNGFNFYTFNFNADSLSIGASNKVNISWGDIGSNTYLGSYTFSGFSDIVTNVTVESNDGFTLPTNFIQIDSTTNSLTLNFVDGSSLKNANLVLDITTKAVPEPASVALLGLGLLGVVAARRKSAKSKNA